MRGWVAIGCILTAMLVTVYVVSWIEGSSHEGDQ